MTSHGLTKRRPIRCFDTYLTKRQYGIYVTKMGRLCHYPECCIEYFCDNIDNIEIKHFENWPRETLIAIKKLIKNKKTFIPCSKCTIQINKNIEEYLANHPNIINDGMLEKDSNGEWIVRK